MHQYLAEFLTVATLHLLAVMSPGPDFVLISKNSLVYSRKSGLYSALGLALGITIHITYSLIGVAYLIAKSLVIFSVIKLLGAGYLIYIGWHALRAKPAANSSDVIENKADLTRAQALKNGFLTNILNPKVSLFFLAIFTQVIHPTTPLWMKLLLGAEMSIMTFVWFAFVATVLSHRHIRKPFTRVQHYVERSMGTVLIALGIKVALSKSH